jgi:hypothetical protein
MKIEIWGPAVWNLFHTLAEKIKEDQYPIIGGQLFGFIRRICANLPCPDCAEHATQFMNRIQFRQIKTKTDFKNMLWYFHNAVNKRKVKPMYPMNDLAIYADYNLVYVFNQFVATYQTKGNMKLLAETFQRRIVVNDLKKWLMENIKAFF